MCAIAQHFGRPGTPTAQAWTESLLSPTGVMSWVARWPGHAYAGVALGCCHGASAGVAAIQMQFLRAGYRFRTSG